MSSKKGIVPILAVILMAVLSVAASGIYYMEVSSAMVNPTPEDVVVTDILLAKHYGYAYFSMTMKSNINTDLIFQVSVIGEDGAVAWIIPNVRLPSLGEVTASDDGSAGSDFFVGKTYVVKIEGDINLAYTVECTGVEVSSGKIILLAINGITGEFSQNMPAGGGPQHINSSNDLNAIINETLWFAGGTDAKLEALIDLWNGDTRVPENSSAYTWADGVPVNFNVTYDAAEGLIYYTVGNTTITSSPPAGATDLFIKAQVDGKGTMSVLIDDLELNGAPIAGVVNTTKFDALWLNGAELLVDFASDFTLTGQATFDWDNPSGNWGMYFDVIAGTVVEGNEYIVETEINPIEASQGVLDTAESLGCPVLLVTTMAQWESILANPPLGAIIVNPFGGSVPAPDWALQDEASAEAFIRELSEVVSNYSWTWVHLGGYPFSSVTNETVTVDTGNDGLEWFFDIGRIKAHGRGIEHLEEYLLTEDDGVSLNHFLSVTGSDPLPGTLWFDYGIIIPASDLPPTKFTFYINPSGVSQTGARSFYLGAGYYVHWGAPVYTQGHPTANQVPDYDSASYALMIALYTVMR